MLHGDHLDQLDVALSEVMFSYNTSVHTETGFSPQFLMFGEEARVQSEAIIGIPKLEQNPSAYSFRRYQPLSLAYDAAREATACAQRRAKDYYDAGAYQKIFQVGDKVRIRIPTLAQSPSKLQSKWSEIHTISKIQGVLATLIDRPTKSQTTVHVDILSACSPRLRDELEAHPSVQLSRSVSSSSLHGSVHDEPKRAVDPVDLATQPRALGKRVPKSSRRNDYV